MDVENWTEAEIVEYMNTRQLTEDEFSILWNEFTKRIADGRMTLEKAIGL